MKLMGLSNQKMLKVVDPFLTALGKEITWLNSSNQIKEILKEGEPGILIITLSGDDDSEEILESCRLLSLGYPQLAVVLITEATNLDIRKAMRSGIFDVLAVPLNQYQVLETIKEAEKHLSLLKQSQEITTDKSSAEKNARVITVCSTKGGVGKTTFTVNLAAAFAKQFKKVAIIDLDLQFGDISMFLDSNPKKTIYEWVKEGRKNSRESIGSYLYSYNEYIDIMPAPIRPEFSEAVSEEHISELVTQLQPYYDLVLIDTAPYMEDKILTALEKSDDIFLLTYLDLPTLKNSKIFIETLKSLSLIKKVKVIINRDSKKKGLDSTTAENVLGVPVFLRIPDVENVVEVSVNEGNPYVFSNPRAKISKIIYSLALQFSDQPVEKTKKSLFGKKVVHAGRTV